MGTSGLEIPFLGDFDLLMLWIFGGGDASIEVCVAPRDSSEALDDACCTVGTTMLSPKRTRGLSSGARALSDSVWCRPGVAGRFNALLRSCGIAGEGVIGLVKGLDGYTVSSTDISLWLLI